MSDPDAMRDQELIERYGQDRFVAERDGEEGRRVRQDNPNPTHPDHSQTTPTAASPKEDSSGR